MQRQLNHGAIYQLDRRQPAAELDDVLRGIHRGVKSWEVHYPQHLGARQLTELQREVFGQRQRAFAANEQVGQIDCAARCVGPFALVAKNVQVVSTHSAHDLGPARIDLRGQLLGQRAHVVAQRAGLAAAVRVVAQAQ